MKNTHNSNIERELYRKHIFMYSNKNILKMHGNNRYQIQDRVIFKEEEGRSTLRPVILIYLFS